MGMKVQMMLMMMPNCAPHPDARGVAHFGQPSQPRATTGTLGV